MVAGGGCKSYFSCKHTPPLADIINSVYSVHCTYWGLRTHNMLLCCIVLCSNILLLHLVPFRHEPRCARGHQDSTVTIVHTTYHEADITHAPGAQKYVTEVPGLDYNIIYNFVTQFCSVHRDSAVKWRSSAVLQCGWMDWWYLSEDPCVVSTIGFAHMPTVPPPDINISADTFANTFASLLRAVCLILPSCVCVCVSVCKMCVRCVSGWVMAASDDTPSNWSQVCSSAQSWITISQHLAQKNIWCRKLKISM